MISRSADRALQIFELFATRLQPLTLSELAHGLAMPVSTCSKLIRTLQARGYLYEVGGHKAYYPTPRWLSKASAISAADPVTEFVRPFLESLRDEVGETCLLGKQAGSQLLHLNLVPGPHSIRYNGQVGDLLPLHSTASGKALLGALPLAERLELVGRLKLSRETRDTITQRKQLLADIEQGAKRGWWTTRSENAPDVMAMAALVDIGPDLYTISVAGPVTRMEPRLEAMAKRLLSVCRRIRQAS